MSEKCKMSHYAIACDSCFNKRTNDCPMYKKEMKELERRFRISITINQLYDDYQHSELKKDEIVEVLFKILDDTVRPSYRLKGRY